jgi:hypothetical protein
MRLTSTIAPGFIALALAFSMACKSDSTADPNPVPAAFTAKSAEGAAHAATNVEPGSHEDWCEEHGVPESQCTRCNPSLVAAFKATGDWCEEHGVPESQCRLCNPDLKIERPPKKEAAQ